MAGRARFRRAACPRSASASERRCINLSEAPRRSVTFALRDKTIELDLPIVLEEVDLFVTLPTPKMRSVTRYSGAVKNQWRCIPDKMRLKKTSILSRSHMGD